MTQGLETRDQIAEMRDERRETRERGKSQCRQEAKGRGTRQEPRAEWHVGNAIAFWLLPIACLLAGGPRTTMAFQKPSPAAAVNASTSEPGEEQLDQARGALDRFLDSHPEILYRRIDRRRWPCIHHLLPDSARDCSPISQWWHDNALESLERRKPQQYSHSASQRRTASSTRMS